jgi:hypothetical protein
MPIDHLAFESGPADLPEVDDNFRTLASRATGKTCNMRRLNISGSRNVLYKIVLELVSVQV